MESQRFEKIKTILQKRQPDLTVITEDVHKPRNISAIMRSCDAVGVLEFHTVNTADTFRLDSRITAGADKWLYHHQHANIQEGIEHLHQRGFSIYAAHFSDRSVDYRVIDYTKPTAFLVGAEKWGVSQVAEKLVDYHITIPMLGMTQSLNVSVATAIILFEAQRQRMERGFYDRLRLTADEYQKYLFEWCYPQVVEIFKAQGKPYPPLDEQGEMILTKNSA